MKEKLISILLDAQRNFNHESLHYVRQLEKALHFEEFTKEEIKQLNSLLLRATIFSYIIYDSNKNILFEHNKNQKCIDKANVTFQTNHSSIYPLMMYAISFEKQNLLDKENYLPIFGSFPIFEQNKLKYVVSMDGKDEINDFVEIISSIKNIQIDKYEGFKPK